MTSIKLLSAIILTVSLLSCKPSSKEKVSRNCMDRALILDDSIGKIRNHACENLSLSSAITNYVDVIDQMDFKNCPEAFKIAFKNHTTAWRYMTDITDKHSELRGEMHDLFEEIEMNSDSVAFKKALKQIWDTWAVIESVSTLKP